MSDNPRIMRYEIEWANHEGNSGFNANILEKNIQAVGGDPFQSYSNVFEKLQNSNITGNDQNNYRSMMFNSWFNSIQFIILIQFKYKYLSTIGTVSIRQMLLWTFSINIVRKGTFEEIILFWNWKIEQQLLRNKPF